MKYKAKQIVVAILILIIFGIFIYLWFLVTLWAIAFLATISVVALIVFGLFKLKHYFRRKSSQKRMDMNGKRGYIEENNDIKY